MDTIFNKTGCFYRALDDEPIFVLLARDPCFAETIRSWETSRQALIGRGEKPQGDHPMLLEALATATAGVAWRNESTDPTNGYDAGEHARWHVETATERELVEVSPRKRKGVPSGGVVMPLPEWLKAKRISMPLGNRFLIGDVEGELVFWENGNYNKPGHPEAWSGYYPVNNSLQKDMLWLAYEDWRNQSRNTVAAIKRLTGGDLTWGEDDKPVKMLSPVRVSEFLDYATAYGEFDENTPNGTRSQLSGEPMNEYRRNAIVIYKRVLGLLPEDYVSGTPETVTATGGAGGIDPAKEALWIDMAEERGFMSAEEAEKARAALPEGTKAAIPSKHLTFMVRDLAKKIATGLRQVTSDMDEWLETKSPKFRNTGSGEKLGGFMDRINGYAAELEAGEADAARFRSRPIRMHPALGMPPEPQGRWTGGKINPSLYAKEVIEGIGKGFGKSYEEVTADYLGTTHIDFEVQSSVPLKGSDKAESDTIDVTDVPEMPPHRFTIFTKARGWAYGRGLEINPAHIPDMLDRMEKDGWHLHAVFGGTVADKVGMLFKRVDPPADFNKAWEWLGSWCGKGLWVAGGLQPHRLEQLRKRIQGDDPVFPVRAMPPSVAEMMAAPTEGVDDAPDMGRGLEP